MAPVPAFAAGNGKRASAASKDAGPSCRTSLRSARVASSARFGADGTRAPMVRVTHLLEPCGRPSWLLSGASTALCLPRSGQLGRVFTSGRGSVRTGSIPHSIPSLLHRAEHNTRREDGGAAPVRAARRERGTSLEFPGPGSAQAGLTARSGRQVNFSFKGNGIGDCRPDAACIPLSAGAVAGAGCSAGGPVAMLLRSSRFGSGHDRRKGGGQALKLASRLCRGCEPNVGEPFRERCGASRRSCRTARTPWRGLGTPGTGTPVEQNGF